MALQLNGAANWCLYGSQRNRNVIRAVTSFEDNASVKSIDEGKVKLGGSNLEVTRLGVGAWSWGDTSYWNNFEWDGKLFFSISFFDIYILSGTNI